MHFHNICNRQKTGLTRPHTSIKGSLNCKKKKSFTLSLLENYIYLTNIKNICDLFYEKLVIKFQEI